MTDLAWEKLPRESAVAYRAFACFRDQGPGRTLREVAAVLYGDEYRSSTRRVPGRIKQWSADNDWVERALALDARDDAIRLEAVELHKLQLVDDTAERIKALREETLANEEKAAELVGRYLDRVERLLDELPLIRQVTVREGGDGVPAIYQIEPATKNPVLDAVRLHKIATRSVPSEVAKRVRNYDLSGATEEQLQRLVDGEDPDIVLGPGWPEIGE